MTVVPVATIVSMAPVAFATPIFVVSALVAMAVTARVLVTAIMNMAIVMAMAVAVVVGTLERRDFPRGWRLHGLRGRLGHLDRLHSQGLWREASESQELSMKTQMLACEHSPLLVGPLGNLDQQERRGLRGARAAPCRSSSYPGPRGRAGREVYWLAGGSSVEPVLLCHELAVPIGTLTAIVKELVDRPALFDRHARVRRHALGILPAPQGLELQTCHFGLLGWRWCVRHVNTLGAKSPLLTEQ
jgi:hypothetical protein